MATKKIKDLKKGDVIRTEFGCEGNFVTVEIQKVQVLDEGSLNCKMYCKYVAGNKVEMYGLGDDEVELIEVNN